MTYLLRLKGWLIKTCGEFCGGYVYGSLLGMVFCSPIIVAFLVWGPPKGAC